MAVMLLTASVGTTVRIEVDGPDEAEAMREIADALPRRLRRTQLARIRARSG
jgi:phosphotransferase system HPr-like phosphotransfer protein